MNLAALIRQMAEAGAPAEAIAVAVEALEAARERLEDEALTPGARRTRRWRERKASQSVTERHDASQTASPNPPSKEIPPRPPKETQPPRSPTAHDHSEGARPVLVSRAKSRRCPEDYAPGPRVLESDATTGFTPGEIERELAKFKDHQFRDAHSDWDAAFRNWLRKTQPSRVVPFDARRPDPPPSATRLRQDANMANAFRGAEIAIARRRGLGPDGDCG